MKKAYISPVTSLLISLSLALGILVSNVSDYGLLTSARADTSPCAETNVVVGETLTLDDALAPSGVPFRNIVVNGQVIEEGVIASPVRLFNSGTAGTDGVLVGNERTCGGSSYTTGVLVGNESPVAGPAGTNGVLVGNEISAYGQVLSSSVTADGGTLTGDDITVTGGVITGLNLTLSDSTLRGGSIVLSGTITGVYPTPGN